MKTLQLTILGALTVLGAVPASAQGLPAGTKPPVYGSVWAAQQREARDARDLASMQAQAGQMAAREAGEHDMQVSAATNRRH